MLVGQRDRARHNIRIETGLGHERACARTCPVELPSVGAILVSAEPSSTKLNDPLANNIEAASDDWLDEMLTRLTELDVARSVRCRIGAVVLDRGLVYAKGGAAWMNTTHTVSLPSALG
jgi:hypothetical protein